MSASPFLRPGLGLGLALAASPLLTLPGRAMPAATAPVTSVIPKAAGGAASTPMRAFDDSIYTLSYEVFLAARNVPDAFALAKAAVEHAPGSPVWAERLAQTAEWNGKPEIALAQWERLGALRPAENPFRQALRLSAMLGDHAAAARAWEGLSRAHPMRPADWLAMAGEYESAGRPETAIERLRGNGQDPGADPATASRQDRAVLERLASLYGRLGRDAEALATLRTLRRRFGADPGLAVQQARLLARHGRIEEAGAALDGAEPGDKAVPGPEHAGYWRMRARLSQWRQRPEDALRAYRFLLAGGAFLPEDARAALELARDRDSSFALEAAEAGWRRFRQGDFLLYSLERSVEAGRWDAAAAALDRLTPEDRRQFAARPYFFDLASRIHQQQGREAEAFREYRQALALDPESEDAKAGYLWLLIQQGRKAELARCLLAWDPGKDPASPLLLPMAMAYKLLRRSSTALDYFRRLDAGGRDGDFPFLLNYAELLEQEGDGEGAMRLYARAARALEAPGEAGRPLRETWEWREARARWAWKFSSGDEARVRMDELLSATGGKEGAKELAFSWRMDLGESPEAAMAALQGASEDPARFPAWADLAVAMSRSDAARVGEVLEDRESSLSLADRASAEAMLGRGREARRLAWESLEDPDLRTGDAPQGIDHLLRAGSGTAEAGLGISSRPLFSERTAWAETDVPLGSSALLHLALADRRRPRISARMPLPMPDRETAAELRLGRHGATSITEVSLGWRTVRGNVGGPAAPVPPAVPAAPAAARIAGDDLMTAGLRHEWSPHGRAALTLEYGRNALADENPTLQLAGAKDLWRAELRLPLPMRSGLGLSAAGEHYYDRGRRHLGKGAEFRAAATQSPLRPLQVAVEGSYHGFEAGPSRPGADGAALIQGWLPRAEFPQPFWQAAARLEWGQEDPAARSLRPAFFAAAEAGLSRFLPAPEQPGFDEAGYGLRGGFALSPTRSQRLSLAAAQARGMRHPSDAEFRVESRYEYYLR